MDFASFVEGPLLRIVFVAFSLVIILRLIFFVFSILKNTKQVKSQGSNILFVFARAVIPFHRAVPKKPIYSSLRYIFHLCLFIVPIWFGGHISLWEESRLEWSWTPIPDGLADWMTIIVMAMAVFFIVRHFAIKDIRSNSSISDYIIVLIAALPFITGYSLTHGTLDSIPFISDNIWTIHILSGELMIFATIFLFCRTRLNTRKCTGCASCVLACPTGTLDSEDSGNLRTFHYSHYQCICCASCVYTCPEGAAELRHELSLKHLFQVFAKPQIRSVEMEACNRCGKLFVPEPLMEKIHKTIDKEYLGFCPDCRKRNIGDYLQRLSPGHRKPKTAA